MITEEMLNKLKNEPITLQAVDPIIYAASSVKFMNEDFGSVEKDNSVIRAFNVAGMKIKCEEGFVNKTQDVFLHFTGKGKTLNNEFTSDKTIYVDTDIYDRYDWNIKNGVLYVTLYEKINPRPDFKRVEKPAKKTEAEEENK